jgi:hypothetical protein
MVRLHLVFGVDSQGFFIDPNAAVDANGNIDPTLQISNVQVQDSRITGMAGMFFISLDNVQVTTDPSVALDISLPAVPVDPLTGATDGKVRFYDLTPSYLDGISAQFTGSHTNDLVFQATAAAGFDTTVLGSTTLKLAWPDLTNPGQFTIDDSDLLQLLQTTTITPGTPTPPTLMSGSLPAGTQPPGSPTVTGQALNVTLSGTGGAYTLKQVVAGGSSTLEVTQNSNQAVLYSAPTSGISQVVITDATGGNSLTIDFANPFSVPVQFNDTNPSSSDNLTVLSSTSGSTLAAAYTPQANTTGAGTVTVGSDTIVFAGLGSLAINNLASLTFAAPASGNNLTLASSAAGTNTLSGTSSGTAFVPLTFFNIGTVTIDTAVNATTTADDTVTIQHAGLVATSLQNFTVRTGSGNDMLLDYAPSYSLPVAGGKFSFDGGAGSNVLVGPSQSLNPNLALYNVGQTIPVPVIVLPGLGGSFATPGSIQAWFGNLGLPPSDLQLDPIENTYTDLVQSLVNAGYVQGQSLFLAPYDWRLPLAPTDGTIDGTLSNLTTTELTGGTYNYAVDYLGSALASAAQAWAQQFDGRSLPAVDVVAHSTGGLLARAYIQSPGYGQQFFAGLNLPRVNNLVMMGVPNQGVLEVWNPLHDNWGYSLNTRLLSEIVGEAYNIVVAGESVATPNGPITRSSITNDGTATGTPDPQKFIQLYLGSFPELLATFPFLNSGNGPLQTVNNYPTATDPTPANNLLLDLNDGLGLNYTVSNVPAGADPNSFLDSPTNSILGQLAVIYSSSVNTVDEEDAQTGTGTVVPLGNFLGASAGPNQVRYQEVAGTQNGDGTVLTSSAIGQFANAAATGTQVQLDPITPSQPGGSVTHDQLPSNATALVDTLATFGQQHGATVISTGHDLPVPSVAHSLETLNANLRSAAIAGLQQLVNLGNELDQSALMQTQIGLIHGSIGQYVNLADILQTRLLDPIQNYFNSLSLSQFPTPDGLIAAVFGASGLNGNLNLQLPGGINVQFNEGKLTFSVGFVATRTTPLTLNLGAGSSSFPLSLSGDVNANLVTTFRFALTFGIDLTQLTSPGDAFFFQVSQPPTVSAALFANGVNLTASLGFANVSGAVLDSPADGVTQVSPTQFTFTGSSLAEDVQFNVSVGGTAPISVNVAAADTQNDLTMTNLATVINAALTAAGLGQEVMANANGNAITFTPLVPNTSLVVGPFLKPVLDAKIGLQFLNPGNDPDGAITLGELENNPLSNIVQLSATGYLDAVMPV